MGSSTDEEIRHKVEEKTFWRTSLTAAVMQNILVKMTVANQKLVVNK